jgi:hypothetical protein
VEVKGVSYPGEGAKVPGSVGADPEWEVVGPR